MNRSCVDLSIEHIGTNDGWQSFLKLLNAAADCPLWYQIGARRIGKTDLCLHIAIYLWQEYGRKTMWLRDILQTSKEKSFQADFLNDQYSLGWISDEPDKKWSCKEDGVRDPNGNLFIKFQSVSTFSTRRGPQHPDVDLIIYDEFIPEDRKYLKHGLLGLMSLTKTVFSGRDGTRCICTSNFVQLSNPHFAGLKIYPDPEKDVTVWHDKGVAVERCRGYRCAITEASPWTKVYQAANYGDYADEFDDEMNRLIKRMPKGARPDKHAIKIDDTWFRIYTAGDGKRLARAEDPRQLGGCVLYVTDPRDLTDNVQMLPLLIRTSIENDIELGRMRYTDQNTLFAFVNLMYNI